MVLTPVPAAVTTPLADPMVATPVFDDDHVPPLVDEERVDELPIHNNSEPVIVPGRLKMVIACIL
jgi:hypothetical protein